MAPRMALNATIHKVELQVSDMDRHYYATHALTLARHPSETEERLMVRLLAFALYADDRLEFGKGLSDEDGSSPALTRRLNPSINRRVTGPAFPSPIFSPSSFTSGHTSWLVLPRKASCALRNRATGTRSSRTGMPSSCAISS